MTKLDNPSPISRLRARTRLLEVAGKLLLQLGGRTACIEPFGTNERHFLQMIAAGITVQDLREQLLGQVGEHECARIEFWIQSLEENGFIERIYPSEGICAEDLARFDRLLHYFSEFETEEIDRFELLRRLRKAKVALIGLGGLGSWVTYNLLSLGVGFLRIVDPDLIEASNLNRSILFEEKDIGRRKVEVAAQSIQRYAPRTVVDCRFMRIDGVKSVSSVADGMDVLISAADQPQQYIREWVARGCHAAQTPYVFGGGLRAGPFCIPRSTSCSLCDWETVLDAAPGMRDAIHNAGELPRGSSGALSAVASITAGIIARDVFFHLSGVREPITKGGIWQMRGDGFALVKPLNRHPRCALCNEGLRRDGL